MALVRIARIADLTEARVIASALESADIPVLVQNGQMGAADFLMQTALGGFGILVPEESAREATAFIRQHRDAKPDLATDIPSTSEDEAEFEAAADDEDWEIGRARRKALVMRWLVVALFVGPAAVAAGVFLILYILAVLRGLFG